MSGKSANTGNALYNSPSSASDGMATVYDNSRNMESARAAFDAYQEARHMEGDLTTRFAQNAEACKAQPALALSDLGAGRAALGPPHCDALSAADMGFERQELADADSAYKYVNGAAADAFVNDPSGTWAAALAAERAQQRGGAKAVNQGGSSMGAPMRLGTGVSFMPTHADGMGWFQARGAAGSGPVAIARTPSSPAFSTSVAGMMADYAALVKKGTNGATAYSVNPGSS